MLWALPFLAFELGTSLFDRTPHKKPKASDPLVGVPDWIASGQVVPKLWGTRRITLFVVQRGEAELYVTGTLTHVSEAETWNTPGLVQGICEGPIRDVRKIWIEHFPVPMSLLATCGMSLQYGYVDATTAAAVGRSANLATTNRDTSRFQAHPGMRFATDRISLVHVPDFPDAAFLPFFADCTRVTLHDIAVVAYETWESGGEGFVIEGHVATLDGTYDVASISDTEIVFSDPAAVNADWSLLAPVPPPDGVPDVLHDPISTSEENYLVNEDRVDVVRAYRYPGLAHFRADPLDQKALYRGIIALPNASGVQPVTDAPNQTSQWEVEAVGGVAGAGPQGLDALPSDIIMDVLTGTLAPAGVGVRLHGAGWDASRVDVVTGTDGTAASGFARYCEEMGWTLSLLLANQQTIAQAIKEVCDATASDVIDSGGVLRVLPFAERTMGAFAPNTRPVYDLGYFDFVMDKGDPVQVDMVPESTSKNLIPVEYVDRLREYSIQLAQIPAIADVAKRGERKGSPLALHCIMRKSHAEEVSRICSRRAAYLSNVFHFALGWNRGGMLDPMDLVRFDDVELGLSGMVVRILAIEEDETGTYQITAEEWHGVPGGTLYVAA